MAWTEFFDNGTECLMGVNPRHGNLPPRLPNAEARSAIYQFSLCIGLCRIIAAKRKANE